MRRLKASKGAKGNTHTMFAEKYLVKKAYFELSNETMKFAFPEPGPVAIVDVNLTYVWRSLARPARKVHGLRASIRKTEGPCLAYVAQNAFTTSHAGDNDVVHLVALCG